MFKKLAALTLLALVVGVTPALASQYPGSSSWDGDDYLSYLTYLGITSSDYTALTAAAVAGLSGQYDITASAYEATQHNYVYDSSNTLLYETGVGNTGNYGTWTTVTDIANLYFETAYTAGGSYVRSDTYTFANDTTSDPNTNRFYVIQLVNPITISVNGNTLNLTAGTLLIFLNDNYNDSIFGPDPDYDTDFDDMVLIATPTPIPGALWLLGTGLLGLVGLRRRFK